MKNLLLLLLFSLGITFSSCLRDECTSHRTFVRFDPIYKTVEALRAEVGVTIGRELRHPGKIYSYGDYLLINEINEGIHIYDNSNAAAPRNITFINIPGNRDMAIKDDILYADNAIDLLAIDISNLAAPKVVKILQAVFSKSFGWNPQWGSQPILVGYAETKETQVLDCSDPNFNLGFFQSRGGGIFLNANFDSKAGVASSSGNAVAAATGVGGSMSRFGIVDNYLYGIDQSDLHVIYVDDAKNPREGKSIPVSWNIETLFPYKDKLFVGASTGMFILDNSNPEAPTLLSSFTHAQACDPVFVDGDIAYITLRSGSSRCQNVDNELDVVDIKNITSPRLIKRYPMSNPQGLSVVGENLYLCEGAFGFKVFNISDVNSIDKNLLNHLTGFPAYDVIALSKAQLLVVGESGLIQLDATNPKNIKTISTIPIVKN